MILNTGSRTDIPAYFPDWFLNRVREGFVLVRNPFDPRQVTRYRISPDVVDCLSFCTKNPGPLLERLEEPENRALLDVFRQFWFVTVTPYGRDLEPHVPDKHRILARFRDLSRRVGIACVGWRYDPIVLTSRYPLEFHLDAFARMASELEGFTDHCVISFIDLYEKTRRNFPEAREPNEDERARIGEGFARIGERHGIRIRTCCEGVDLARFGVDCSGCMTRPVLERAVGEPLDVPRQVKPPRQGCDCLLGSDIGAYDSCGHGCVYCYANQDRAAVDRNMRRHDPDSPMLIGRLQPDDMVREARQASWMSGQVSMFGH